MLHMMVLWPMGTRAVGIAKDDSDADEPAEAEVPCSLSTVKLVM